MSREIRRVPLDFDAPPGKTWAGYLMPEHLTLPPCPDCRNGMTAAREWLNAAAHMLLMLGQDIGAQQAGQGMHPYLAENAYAPTDFVPGRRFTSRTLRPAADIAELVAGLSGKSVAEVTNRHGSCDYWTLAATLAAAAGLDPQTWGLCPTCHGLGTTPTAQQQAAHDAWRPTEPPAGEGWQLWQTVSEGGPVSPVFADPEALARWLVDEAGPLDRCSSMQVARRFVAAGWAPSGFSSAATGYVQGPEFVGRTEAAGA